MVRLKDKCSRNNQSRNRKFQFQYGAIKGCLVAKGNLHNQVFQFQYGAIKGVSG